MVVSAMDHLALTRENASDWAIKNAYAQKHINGEVFDDSKPDAYLEVKNSFKHRYGALNVYFLFLLFIRRKSLTA